MVVLAENDQSTRWPVFSLYQDVFLLSKYALPVLLSANIDARTVELPLWLNVYIHKLLSIRPLESNDEIVDSGMREFEEAFRVAMLLYLGCLWIYFGASTYSQPLVYKQHQSLRNKRVWAHCNKHLWRLQVWILCMSAFEASNLDDGGEARRFFLHNLADIVDIGSDPISIAEDVLWAPRIFDTEATHLKEDIEMIRLEI